MVSRCQHDATTRAKLPSRPSTSTRIYLHLADDWLAGQGRRAAEAIDVQVFAEHPAKTLGGAR